MQNCIIIVKLNNQLQKRFAMPWNSYKNFGYFCASMQFYNDCDPNACFPALIIQFYILVIIPFHITNSLHWVNIVHART